MLASYAALDLAGRVRSESGATRIGWIGAGGTVMGLGIWSMHFVGMLAFHLPVPIAYDVPLMLLSVVVAIAASLLALVTINTAKLRLRALLPGGLLMGGAIAGMHYIGMASIRADARLTYSAATVALSVLIAIVASLAALWLSFRFRSDVTARGMILKMMSAVVMGVAIAGMHYTGMAAARFAPSQTAVHASSNILASSQLGTAVVTGAILIIALAIIGAVIDRNMQARSVFTRQLAEQTVALGKSERQYRLLFDSNPNPMWVYSTSALAFQAVNEAAIAHYGYSRDEFLAMTLNDIRVESTTSSLERFTWASYGAGTDGSWFGRHRKKDGSLIDVEVSSQEIVFDGLEARLGLAVDVTNARRAEEAVRQNEQRTRLIIDTALDAVITMDARGRILEWNTQAETMFGWPRAEVLGQRIAEKIIPVEFREAHQTGLRKFLESGEGPLLNRRVEITALRRDGSFFPIELAISPAKLGSDWTFNAFIRDLTEKKSLEAQLQHASKMEAVGQLAGGIAHDFNNILTVIMSYGAMLLDNIDEKDPNREDVQQIATAADRAATLTRQLLAFSRKQVMQPQVLSINKVISGIEIMLRRLIGEHIQLEVSLDQDLPPISVDPGQLEQVLVNLVVNARDAMPDGGRLLIATESSDPALEYDGGIPRVDDDVVLVVRDTGVGMREEVQRRIFDPFFTTKERGRGTGLGLATAYGIVKQSGGEITVQSQVGKGTTFKVYFPRFVDPAGNQRGDDHSETIPRGNETVLLVEDDATLRKLAERILTECGYVVLPAAGGEEALEIASNSATVIDAIVTDVVMPGINGRELVERLVESRPGIATLLMSGYNDDQVLQRGVMHGETAFLQKPFSAEQFARKVRGILDRAS